MNRSILATIISVVIVNYSWSQGLCPIAIPQDSTNWGIGVIRPPKFDFVKGKHLSSGSTWIIKYDIKKGDSTKRVDDNDIIYAGFYSQFYKVYEIRNTSLKILKHTINGGLWVEMDDINLVGSPFHTYQSLVFNLDKTTEHYKQGIYNGLGVNLFSTCLNLRTKPNKDSDIITCIKNNNLEMGFVQINIIKNQDKWAYVSVKYFDWHGHGESGEGCDYTLNSEKFGWIKAIGDSGYPNIWYPITRE